MGCFRNGFKMMTKRGKAALIPRTMSHENQVELIEMMTPSATGEFWRHGQFYTRSVVGAMITIPGDPRALPEGTYRVINGELYRILETSNPEEPA